MEFPWNKPSILGYPHSRKRPPVDCARQLLALAGLIPTASLAWARGEIMGRTMVETPHKWGMTASKRQSKMMISQRTVDRMAYCSLFQTHPNVWISTNKHRSFSQNKTERDWKLFQSRKELTNSWPSRTVMETSRKHDLDKFPRIVFGRFWPKKSPCFTKKWGSKQSKNMA